MSEAIDKQIVMADLFKWRLLLREANDRLVAIHKDMTEIYKDLEKDNDNARLEGQKRK